ncbi:hypothetical protein GJAV_G00245530 [Gymnothorax javanicus]|nr:hypothetical protein GJAV_G00245530 [Gymnothorax javanicus]
MDSTHDYILSTQEGYNDRKPKSDHFIDDCSAYKRSSKRADLFPGVEEIRKSQAKTGKRQACRWNALKRGHLAFYAAGEEHREVPENSSGRGGITGSEGVDRTYCLPHSFPLGFWQSLQGQTAG